MFPSLLLLCCLSLTIESSHGEILPPRNVSLRRINDFDHNVTWVPPENSVGYQYKVSPDTNDENIEFPVTTQYTYIVLEGLMNGNVLNVSIRSLWNKSSSEPVVVSETNPELVTDFQCYVHSSYQTNCSWSPTGIVADLRFFYKSEIEWNGIVSGIEECPSYTYTDGLRTGCYLPVSIQHSLSVLFNTTLNNKTVRNTFSKDLFRFVRPPPLNWKVKKSGNQFNITWDSPEVIAEDEWEYIINYTECGQLKRPIILKEKTSYQLLRLPHCSYSMAIKAKYRENGETPWTDHQYFEADSGFSPLVILAITIPLVVATLTVLTVICYQKVPEPRDLLSDICDNNNKTALCNFQAMGVEEDNCKIALVVEPKISKPDW
ncbi:interleukin-13 receptor subunit alpha-1 isoform X2 [Neolamprologus brichardi]|uniref:interleukin-13 receptor subunit alpha-1 isoform X2 n=1 Tax=Neolamprologus brichardi TaxID=32507 RepID=UPI0003EBD3C5|nr:interleukin-13 receptor subunit alpha-1 isoform X2 [Neolamprologus brichardi]